MSPEQLTCILVACSFVTSTISGILGMAGGLTLMAIMVALGMDAATAVPVHAAVQLVSNGTRVYAFLPRVRWPILAYYGVAAIPALFVGDQLLSVLDTQHVSFILGVAVLYALLVPKWGVERIPERLSFMIAGSLAGALGIVIGATGPLIAPFFLRKSFVKEQIIATKAVCQTFTHMLKICYFGFTGFLFLDSMTMILPMGAAAIGGTYMGKYLLGKLDEKRFRLFYRIILGLLAIKLILP